MLELHRCGTRTWIEYISVRWLHITILVLLMLVGFPHILSGGGPAAAQPLTIDWSQPINLSNSPESSGRPAIVADGYGYVHVFWSEEVGGESILDIPQQLIHNGNTIFYTRWDGVSWTRPIDILFVSGDPIADYVAVTVDAKNRLHAVWTGQSNFYYSTAPSWQAGSARAWTEPVVVATFSARSQWESDIVVDALGIIHILYATRGDESGVYHTLSSDGGITWQLPAGLSEPLDKLERAFSNTMIITDDADRLHAIWQTNENKGYGQGVYYARSPDGGGTWTAPVRMAYRDPGEFGVGFPYIASIGESELHVIYIDGDWHIGRWHRISRDGGATWSEPSHIITNLEGINGYTIPLVDGADRLHLITTMRTLDQVSGPVFYARWLGTGWSPVELPFIGSDETGPGAHWTAATVRLGNEIHVLWNTNQSHRAGEVWYTRGKIPGVAQASPLPTPTARPSAAAPAKAAPITGRRTISALSVPTRAPTITPLSATSGRRSLDLLGLSFVFASPSATLLLGMAPALLVIIGVIVWTRGRPG